MATRQLIIGLDGFEPSLARRWMDAGHLPHLAKIREQGVFSTLRSTIPPFTYPAWSTFLTGTNPGKHGIIDFTQRIPGTYSLRFVNATFRRMPTFFKLLSGHGRKVGAMGIPTTYPPSAVNGFMISGFDSPVAVNANKTFYYPESLFSELKEKVHAYTLTGIQEISIDSGWHSRAEVFLREMVERRGEIAEYLLQRMNYDVFTVVFSESDTVSHHFWSFYDTNSPRHDPHCSDHATAIRDIYIALDTAVGRLVACAGPDADIFIVSDHGFGGTGARSISINRILAHAGLFKYRKHSADSRMFPMLSVNRIIRFIPVALQEWLFRNLGGVIPAFIESRNQFKYAELSACLALSGELNYFPSVWIHDTRFPEGRAMSTAEREQIIRDVIQALQAQMDPVHHQPLFRNVYRREEIYHGDALHLIPDLVLELNYDNGYSYPITRCRTPGEPISPLPESELSGRKGGSMNGSHRPFGTLLASGPSIKHCDDLNDPGLEDIAPTILALAGFDPPDSMDGRILYEMLTLPDKTNRTPVNFPDTKTAPMQFNDAENRELKKRLEQLGYL